MINKNTIKGRAILDQQKNQVIKVLSQTWKKYPELRLGQLLSNTVGDLLSHIEDGPLQAALASFDPSKKVECNSFSKSGNVKCTLTIGHFDKKHFNEDIGVSWTRY